MNIARATSAFITTVASAASASNAAQTTSADGDTDSAAASSATKGARWTKLTDEPLATAAAKVGISTSKGLDQLGSALGISSGEIVDRLTQGQTLSDLLTGNTAATSKVASMSGRGMMIDGYA